MGYFYNPPQPVQATPHVPIGNQGQQPPRRTLHSFYALRGSWAEPTWPAQSAPRIAPQTLVYGQQPPSRTNAQLLALRALWPEPTWSSQSEPDNASYNIAPVIQPPYAARALFYAQRGLWPETTWPAQSAARIAPQTLIYGDQPPRLRGPQAFWPQVVWTAQSVSPNAGWNVAAPIVASVPPPIPQWHIWQAWQPVQAIAQGSGIGASWNIPAQVDNPPPQPAIQWHIWASWNSPPIPQQAVSLQQIDGIVSPQPIFPVLQPGPVDSPRIAEGAYRRKRKKLRRSLESKDPVFIAPASLERLPQAIIERVPDFTTLVRTLGETPAAVSARIDREIAQIIREQDEADDEDALLMILTALED